MTLKKIDRRGDISLYWSRFKCTTTTHWRKQIFIWILSTIVEHYENLINLQEIIET